MSSWTVVWESISLTFLFSLGCPGGILGNTRLLEVSWGLPHVGVHAKKVLEEGTIAEQSKCKLFEISVDALRSFRHYATEVSISFSPVVDSGTPVATQHAPARRVAEHPASTFGFKPNTQLSS